MFNNIGMFVNQIGVFGNFTFKIVLLNEGEFGGSSPGFVFPATMDYLIIKKINLTYKKLAHIIYLILRTCRKNQNKTFRNIVIKP